MEISPYSVEEVPRDWELDSHLDCGSPHYELPESIIDEMDSDITPPMPDASDPGTPSTMSSSAD